MIFTIIGIGETGTAIAHELLIKYRNIQLNIIDNGGNVTGRLLDLAHAGVGNNNSIAHNDSAFFEKSDFIFFCAGTRNKVGEAREAMAASNKLLIEQIFSNHRFHKSPTIIVISNPVDAMATWIKEKVSTAGIVIGTGTLLDSWRLKLIISNYFNIDLERINAVVLGEHGENMLPLWSQITIDSNPVSENYGQEDIDAIELELRNSARVIRSTENATKYGVGAVAVYLLELLLQDVKSYSIVSFKGPKDDVCYGQMCLLSSAGIEVAEMNISDPVDLSRLQQSISHVRSILNA